MSNIKRVTHWKLKTTDIYSEYGVLPYLDWCKKEVERRDSKEFTHYVKENGNQCALFSIQNKKGKKNENI